MDSYTIYRMMHAIRTGKSNVWQSTFANTFLDSVLRSCLNIARLEGDHTGTIRFLLSGGIMTLSFQSPASEDWISEPGMAKIQWKAGVCYDFAMLSAAGRLDVLHVRCICHVNGMSRECSLALLRDVN